MADWEATPPPPNLEPTRFWGAVCYVCGFSRGESGKVYLVIHDRQSSAKFGLETNEGED